MKYIIFDEWFEKKYTWINKDTIIYNYHFLSFNHDPPMYELPDDLYTKFKSKEFKIILENNEKFLAEKENLKILLCLSENQKKYIENVKKKIATNSTT